MGNKILILGTFDSKGREFSLLYAQIKKSYDNIMTMNTGIKGTTDLFPVDIEAEEVAEAGACSLAALREKNDRGVAIRIMGNGARVLVDRLYQKGEIAGIIGMGGGGGTAIATTAMRNLPIGFPKICITTMASGETSPYVGTKDIILFPSIVDICGVNRFFRHIISRAVGAIYGMVTHPAVNSCDDRLMVFISMFGNTTRCVDHCREILDQQGYDSIVFHATGMGGRVLEELTMERYPAAVLDITTTEWADEIVGGIFSAGPGRLDSPGIMGIPHLIVPGCVDMVNFGPMDTVPVRFKKAGRQFFEWSPIVTLMRTTREENEKVGKVFAEKANKAKGPVKFLFPMRGLSELDGENQPFCDWKTDGVLFETIKRHVNPNIEIAMVDSNINDRDFAEKGVAMILEMMEGVAG